mgnify:FL=1
MHDEMIRSIAESRGYDRGFTAGTLHAHELLNNYVTFIEQQYAAVEGDDNNQYIKAALSNKINLLIKAKGLIRRGHWDEDDT